MRTRAVMIAAATPAGAGEGLDLVRVRDRYDITAEGIETRGELEALRNLGVHKAQGYYLSRPGSMEDA